MTILEYVSATFEVLETFDYPALVIEFNDADVANTIYEIMKYDYLIGISPRLCAIIIWSFTINYQIIPRYSQFTKQ